MNDDKTRELLDELIRMSAPDGMSDLPWFVLGYLRKSIASGSASVKELERAVAGARRERDRRLEERQRIIAAAGVRRDAC